MTGYSACPSGFCPSQVLTPGQTVPVALKRHAVSRLYKIFGSGEADRSGDYSHRKLTRDSRFPKEGAMPCHRGALRMRHGQLGGDGRGRVSRLSRLALASVDSSAACRLSSVVWYLA